MTIDRDYVVFGLTGWNGGIWYYIADDDRLDWPHRYSSALFSVIDGSVPDGWRLNHAGEGRNHVAYLAFPEWADDWFFYDRLTDRDETEVRIYRRYRERLESALRAR